MTDMEKLYEAGLRMLDEKLNLHDAPKLRAGGMFADPFTDTIEGRTTDEELVNLALEFVKEQNKLFEVDVSLTALAFFSGYRLACQRIEARFNENMEGMEIVPKQPADDDVFTAEMMAEALKDEPELSQEELEEQLAASR